MEIEPEENTTQESTINGRYKIIEKKGMGASANVYLCENLENHKQYAVKVLKQVSPSFQKEIQILEKISKLNCPYIVNFIEFGEGQVKIASKPNVNKQYLVLEYAEKGEIFDYIYCSQEGLKEKYAKLIFKKILKGVDAIHKSGICHRDLKMQNILVDKFFNPKICDFGFAEKIEGKDGSGKLNDFLGTANYAAPEIFLHRPYNGVKADIFSLGVVLLNLVTCKNGFVKAVRNDKYYRNIMTRKFAKYWNDVKGQLGELSEELKNLYIKMVSFNPDERPSIEEILNDPWMKEINDLNEEEYKKLEKEVFQDFKEKEIKVLEKNENIEASSSSDISLGDNRGIEDEIGDYFNLEINPKLCVRTGLGMNNYIKINGKINPSKFMNSLVSKINSEFEDKISLAPINKDNLKFEVIFEDNDEEEEGDLTEEDKQMEEELDKMGLENVEDFEDALEKKNSVIQVKLFESLKGGYIVRFVKKGGEIEDYHKNLDNLINIVKKLL